MLKTIFFGSSFYSTIILNTLLQNKQIDIVAVITKPNKPTGRTQTITANPVTSFAQKNSLDLFQPTDFDFTFLKKYRDLSPNLAICVAYGPPFFSQEMIDIPTYKIINIHPSPLPKYRGATPGPWQIINGETTSAVTFFQIDALPDHGPIISQISFGIDPSWTSHDFYQHAFTLASQHLHSVLESYISNPTFLIPQDHNQRSYYPKLTKEQAKIDWSWSPDKIERFIRAMNPWPIAWTYVTNPNNNRLFTMKIFSSQIVNNQLLPKQVQIAGKRPTTWQEIHDHLVIDNQAHTNN